MYANWRVVMCESVRVYGMLAQVVTQQDSVAMTSRGQIVGLSPQWYGPAQPALSPADHTLKVIGWAGLINGVYGQVYPIRETKACVSGSGLAPNSTRKSRSRCRYSTSASALRPCRTNRAIKAR